MALRDEVTEAWPFRTAEGIRRRLDRHSDRSDPNVCWNWQGYARSPKNCCLRFVLPDGRALLLQVKHLTWWLKHGERIIRPLGLRPACETGLCVNPDHFTRINSRRERRWTEKEVEALRKEYWGTEARPGRRYWGNRPEDHVFRAATSLGLSRGTVQRVIDGKRIFPAKWARSPLTPEQILEAVEQAKKYVLDAQERHSNRLTHLAILGREDGKVKPSITPMLTGKTYRRAGGPTGRVRQVATALDEIDDEEELAEL